MRLKKNINVIKPENYKILTETVDMGNFYGKPFERRFILLEVNTTIDFLNSKDLGFMFENKLDYYLHWIAIATFSSNRINKIKICETDQLKREYTHDELFPNGEYISPITVEYYTFNELTDGVLV
jgi:hypothetical protein